MSRNLAIGLLWHSDRSGNLGVGALTVGHLALIARAAALAGVQPSLHLFQPADRNPGYVADGIASRHDITGRYMAGGGYWRDIGRLQLMLDIGAGDSFADIYPDKRFAYIIATKLMCFWRRLPLVLAPQTIGPFTRQPHKALAAYVLRRARAVFARDALSFDAARALAPAARLAQAIDVAFALPHAPQPTTPGRVGVNVSGLLWSGGYGGANDFGLSIDYRQFTLQLTEQLLARGQTVELISHVTTPMARDDDLSAAQAVHAALPATQVVPPFASPSAAKSHISGLEFLVAARMHASIAAWSAGVPVLPVSYSRKFEGLYGALGYDWLVPMTGLTTADAVARALAAFDARAAIRGEIACLQPAVEARLNRYVQDLAAILREAGQ